MHETPRLGGEVQGWVPHLNLHRNDRPRRVHKGQQEWDKSVEATWVGGKSGAEPLRGSSNTQQGIRTSDRRMTATEIG